MSARTVHSLSTLTPREFGISTGVGPHVPLQFVGVPAGIAAQAALERALSGVWTDVAFQFANLEAKSKTEVSTDEQARLPKLQETSQEFKVVYTYLGTKPNKHVAIFSAIFSLHIATCSCPLYLTSQLHSQFCLMLVPTLTEAWFRLCAHLTVIDHLSIWRHPKILKYPGETQGSVVGKLNSFLLLLFRRYKPSSKQEHQRYGIFYSSLITLLNHQLMPTKSSMTS